MREIKFRGKRVDNGEWIYGDYFQSFCENKAYINSTNCLEMNKLDFVEIDYGTIGQFTGLTDKNGKEIYEGDIVRDQWNSYTPIYQNAIYMAYNAEKINDLYVSTQFNVIWRNGCKVIGNIHDNPELLGVSNA